MRTLYNYIVYPPDGVLTGEYLKEIREYELFKPILELRPKDDEDEGSVDIAEYKFKLITYIASAYSRESPYNKLSDTLIEIQTKICNDLGIPKSILTLISEFRISEIESCITKYINRETNEFVQQYLIARQIHALNLQLSASTIDPHTGSLIEPKMQIQYFETADKFKDKMFEMKQEFSRSNNGFMEFVRDFQKKSDVKGLHIEDIIPL